MIRRFPVYWAKCLCHIWPLSAFAGLGRCGECGTRPIKPCEAPLSGKATRL